jgi:hypothetical protein
MHSDFILDTSNEYIDLIKASFPQVKFTLYKALVSNDVFLSGLSCWVENEEVLESLWSRINSLVASEYQTKLDDDFSSWNIYLAFFTDKKISNALKYTIENDTFFVRKIVFDNQLVELKEEKIAGYFNDHILGKDILVDSVSMKKVLIDPEYSPITQSLLRANIHLGPAKKDKELREAWLDKAILEVGSYEV